MANLTQDAYIKIWGEAWYDKWLIDSSAAQTIYKGQPLILDLSEDTTKVRGFVDATVVDAADIFIGIAAEGTSILIAATEDVEVKVLMEPSVVGFAGAVFGDDDVGDPVYMDTSGSLSATIGDNPVIGSLVRVKDGFQYVRLLTPVICAGA